MLNKEVCKKCLVEKYGDWLPLDDILWNKYRIVNCHRTRIEVSIDIDENIIDCDYVLEHLILNGDMKNETGG